MAFYKVSRLPGGEIRVELRIRPTRAGPLMIRRIDGPVDEVASTMVELQRLAQLARGVVPGAEDSPGKPGGGG